jgi:hypothetical protein
LEKLVDDGKKLSLTLALRRQGAKKLKSGLFKAMVKIQCGKPKPNQILQYFPNPSRFGAFARDFSGNV